MIFIALTSCLVLALAVNHVVHGFGCWGFQPGGAASGLIYELQTLTAMVGIGWLVIAISQRKLPIRPARLLLIGLFTVASVAMYLLTGWTAHTSAQHQGAENLLAFAPVVVTTLATGAYGWRLRSHRRAISESKSGLRRDETENPYQSPLK